MTPPLTIRGGRKGGLSRTSPPIPWLPCAKGTDPATAHPMAPLCKGSCLRSRLRDWLFGVRTSYPLRCYAPPPLTIRGGIGKTLRGISTYHKGRQREGRKKTGLRQNTKKKRTIRFASFSLPRLRRQISTIKAPPSVIVIRNSLPSVVSTVYPVSSSPVQFETKSSCLSK